MTVLVLIEPDDELSLQAVTLARALGGEVHGISIGHAEAPVDVLHVATIDGSYAPAAWAASVVQVVERVAPDTGWRHHGPELVNARAMPMNRGI